MVLVLGGRSRLLEAVDRERLLFRGACNKISWGNLHRGH